MSQRVEAVVLNPTHRGIIVDQEKKRLGVTNRTRTVIVWDETTDTFSYYSAEEAHQRGISTTDFPHLTPEHASQLFDKADHNGGTYREAAYDTSTIYSSTDEAVRKKGGDPNYRIPKNLGWLTSHPSTWLRKDEV